MMGWRVCVSPLRVGEAVRLHERSLVCCFFSCKLSISIWGNWVGPGAEGQSWPSVGGVNVVDRPGEGRCDTWVKPACNTESNFGPPPCEEGEKFRCQSRIPGYRGSGG